MTSALIALRLSKAKANLAAATEAKRLADIRIRPFFEATPRNLEAPVYLAERAKWLKVYGDWQDTSRAVAALASRLEELQWDEANGLEG